MMLSTEIEDLDSFDWDKWYFSEKYNGIRAYYDGNKLFYRNGLEINGNNQFKTCFALSFACFDCLHQFQARSLSNYLVSLLMVSFSAVVGRYLLYTMCKHTYILL